MVAMPDEKSVKEETFQNGKATFEKLVMVYNAVIASLKEIEDDDPQKCADFIDGRAFPLTNLQMVELLYFMQQVIDDIEHLDLD